MEFEANTCLGILVEGDQQKEVSIALFPAILKGITKVRLTVTFQNAIVSMCGGDESRPGYGRMTSTGGSGARSQLRNRPLGSVRFNFSY